MSCRWRQVLALALLALRWGSSPAARPAPAGSATPPPGGNVVLPGTGAGPACGPPGPLVAPDRGARPALPVLFFAACCFQQRRAAGSRDVVAGIELIVPRSSSTAGTNKIKGLVEIWPVRPHSFANALGISLRQPSRPHLVHWPTTSGRLP